MPRFRRIPGSITMIWDVRLLPHLTPDPCSPYSRTMPYGKRTTQLVPDCPRRLRPPTDAPPRRPVSAKQALRRVRNHADTIGSAWNFSMESVHDRADIDRDDIPILETARFWDARSSSLTEAQMYPLLRWPKKFERAPCSAIVSPTMARVRQCSPSGAMGLPHPVVAWRRLPPPGASFRPDASSDRDSHRCRSPLPVKRRSDDARMLFAPPTPLVSRSAQQAPASPALPRSGAAAGRECHRRAIGSGRSSSR